MKFTSLTTGAVSAGLLLAALAVAAPAQAQPDNDFLGALLNAGVTGVDPATAVSVGQSVCPMLSEPGQRLADVAATVSNAIGRPLGPATMFTGVAISLFCPSVVSKLANGDSPFGGIPLDLLGV